jgi:hypothetical protein
MCGKLLPLLTFEKGIPGCGKTILAASAVQELTKLVPSCGVTDTVVCYYFFSYKFAEKSSSQHAYRSILAQILQQCRYDERIVDMFSFARSKSRAESGLGSATEEELSSLLDATSRVFQTTLIVLDGIDECEDPEKLIQNLQSVSSSCNVKLLLFSRPNVHTLRKIDKSRCITVSRAAVESDLRTFFLPHVENLQVDGLLPPGQQSEELVADLLSNANGMFLWARLMVAYLNSPALVPTERLAAIRDLHSPDCLEDMYIRIICTIRKKMKAEQELARRIFIWLSYSQSNLTAAQLEEILTPSSTLGSVSATQATQKRGVAEKFTDFEHTVTMVCGSLVELYCGSYQFIHKSVYEFFTNRPDSANERSDTYSQVPQHLIPSPAEAHCELATDCIKYFVYVAPAQPLSGDFREKASTTQIRKLFPFLIYAQQNWTCHLVRAKEFDDGPTPLESKTFLLKAKDLLRTLSKFLSTKLVLTSWVESLYMFVPQNDRGKSFEEMQTWSDWAQRQGEASVHWKEFDCVPVRLSAFATDLVEIHSLWATTLHEDPHKVWGDITAFTPSLFLAQNSATSVRSMASLQFGDSHLSNKPLSTISAKSMRGDAVGVLSIWTSKSVPPL